MSRGVIADHHLLGQRGRHAGNERAVLPALLGRLAGLAVRGGVVNLADEGADRLIQPGQGEPGLPAPVNGALGRMAGQVRQAHLVDGAEDPLHLPPARAARAAGTGAWMRRSAITCSRWAEVKSEPRSRWNTSGIPYTCQSR